MKYLVDAERPIFLNFLNREAAAASGSSRTIDEVLNALEALTVCHCSTLTVNISQMIEYSANEQRLTSPLSALARGGILITTSHDSNISEFISSRRSMYRNVASRYPMYFEDSSALEQFRIAQANSFSMTKLLRRDILDMSASELDLVGKRARSDDLAVFKAHTRANFKLHANGALLPDPALDAAARVFSALYAEHYAQHNSAVTCSGLGDTGYVEDLRHFPHYDVPILKSLLKSLGWDVLRGSTPDLLDQICATYGSPKHRAFVETANAFLHACHRQVISSSNSVAFDGDSVGTLRAIVCNLSTYLIRTGAEGRHSNSVIDFYVTATEVIAKAASRQSAVDASFRSAWEENMPPKKRVRLLLLTATDVEDDAVAEALTNAGFRKEGTVSVGEGYGAQYVGGLVKEVVHVRSSAGSVGASGSELVSADAIKTSNADFIVAVGICFGLKEDKTNLGDVLVSDQVVDYEMVRVEETGLRERGTRTPPGPKLLSAARLMRSDYNTAGHAIAFGQMISGLKLVDSPTERQRLKERFPDALGGEMEANGIVAAASRTRREWLIVKAICDWAFAKGGSEQKVAAQNAARYAVKVIDCVLDAETNKIIN